MNVLIVGSEGRGSWAMRGVQLGSAIGARVTTDPKPSQWQWADVVVLVKRAAIRWADQARSVRVPVVWDALDFWRQPEDNGLSEAEMVESARQIAECAGVKLIIGATDRMARDLGGVCVPHHCRIGLQPSRDTARRGAVGYDGQKKYLGRWLPALETACYQLGMRFVVNPPSLHEVDVLVSFRDGPWDGWACREWKSGVKYVNAVVAGKPVLSQYSAALHEIKPVAYTLDRPELLVEALQHVTSEEARQDAHQMGLKRAASCSVDAVAKQYLSILTDVARRAA